MSLIGKAILDFLSIFGLKHKDVTKDDGFNFVTSMGIVRNLGMMGYYIQIPADENMALRGIELYHEGKHDHPLVNKWKEFTLTAKTNGDVWKFFCDCHAFDPELIVGHYYYDDAWFKNWSNSPISEGNRFGISEKQMKQLWE